MIIEVAKIVFGWVILICVFVAIGALFVTLFNHEPKRGKYTVWIGQTGFCVNAFEIKNGAVKIKYDGVEYIGMGNVLIEKNKLDKC